MCATFTWESDGTMMHCGMTKSWREFWETLGPDIHVDVNLARATYLNIVVDLRNMMKSSRSGLQIPLISIQLGICGMYWINKFNPR